ncbi:hypothetical protein F8517_01845 [Bacillus thuringiensis]|uniref:DUF6843 domain-containing protein n=1 Tax=Bacillus thuringiensis TaxID=1428 RepID=UPI00124C64AA|nr:hypothetical protein [Bacillus thuringiensis]KAB2370024.1 hypothetical protein F8517_01845 [Bacillus thuringiensis]
MRKVIMYCGIFIMILLSGCIRFGQDTTDTIYLIPEAYEGDLLVLYNVPGAELLPEEDGFRVVTFSADGREVSENQEHPVEKKLRELLVLVKEQYMKVKY